MGVCVSVSVRGDRKEDAVEYVLAAACHREIFVDACNGVQLQRHGEQ